MCHGYSKKPLQQREIKKRLKLATSKELTYHGPTASGLLLDFIELLTLLVREHGAHCMLSIMMNAML